MRVFLDIDIGDRETYDRKVAAHKITADYLTSVGSQVTIYVLQIDLLRRTHPPEYF